MGTGNNEMTIIFILHSKVKSNESQTKSTINKKRQYLVLQKKGEHYFYINIQKLSNQQVGKWKM